MAFTINKGVLEKYRGSDTKVVIPDGVTMIDARVFYNCSSLASITLPAGVTSIGAGAFRGCSRLKSITIPAGVTSIGGGVFADCSRLKSITIPAGVTSIGESAFAGCRHLKSITIPESVVSIEKSAFKECENLKTVYSPIKVLPDAKMKRICAFSFFRNPIALENVVYREELRKYMSSQKKRLLPDIFSEDMVSTLALFAELDVVNEKNIDNDFIVPAVEANATQCVALLLNWKNKNVSEEYTDKQYQRRMSMIFAEKQQKRPSKDQFNVSDMKKQWEYSILEDDTVAIDKYKGTDTDVSIPERIGKRTVTSIGEGAFKYCNYNIKSICIPGNVMSIGRDAFRGCSNLTSVTIPDSVTSIGPSAFYGCGNLNYVVLSRSMTCIEGSTFNNCSRLRSITVPTGVTSIGACAFAGCRRLISITIPYNVTNIGYQAFCDCAKLAIRTSSGSHAEAYAIQNDIPVEIE